VVVITQKLSDDMINRLCRQLLYNKKSCLGSLTCRGVKGVGLVRLYKWVRPTHTICNWVTYFRVWPNLCESWANPTFIYLFIHSFYVFLIY